MKNIFCFVFFVLFVHQVSARDLTYKFGAGWKQFYTNARVDERSRAVSSLQLSGLDFSYGVAKDLQVGAYFGFLSNFDFAMAGPSLRYEFHRLINRNLDLWKHLHLFTEVAFLAKFGNESKSGICLHAPYFGLEILPVEAVHLSVTTSAGLVIDFVNENSLGFTQGLIGDLGIRYYF